MTNRERINNMSNTELAEFMAKLSAIYNIVWDETELRAVDKSCYSFYVGGEDTEALDACTAANVAWLESEAENCGN